MPSITLTIMIVPLLPQLPALARVITIRGILPPSSPARVGKGHVPMLVKRDALATATIALWKRGWSPWLRLEVPASPAVKV